MPLVENWLVLLASLTISQAVLTRHQEFTLESSHDRGPRGQKSTTVAITCKLGGPNDLFLVWREKCKNASNDKPVSLDTNAEITEKRSDVGDLLCEKTNCSPKVELASKYILEFPADYKECAVICCGYSQVFNSTPLTTPWPIPDMSTAGGDADFLRESSSVYKSVLPIELLKRDTFRIWPKEHLFQYQRTHGSAHQDKMLVKGECRSITVSNQEESRYHRPSFSVELVVYFMVGASVFSLIGSCTYVFISEDQTNKAKSRQFRQWAHRQKRRSTIRKSAASDLQGRTFPCAYDAAPVGSDVKKSTISHC